MQVPRMTAEELKRCLDEGEVPLIVDVRSRADYDRAHIVGAMSVPIAEIELHYGEFAHDRFIVCY